jgi:glycine/D-amino acid oxidase-like deaminating enzyme
LGVDADAEAAVVSDTVASVGDARPVSVWLDRPERANERATERWSGGRSSTDLLVIGGGLTGLWAAVEAAGSGRDVMVVEAGALGGGASGRCGGFINASITHGIAHGHARWPAEMPDIIRLQQAIWDDTLDLLATHGAAHAVEPCGKFTVATRPHQLSELDSAVELLRGYGQTARRLDREEIRAEVDSPSYLGGQFHADANGLCDPVALIDALAAIASARGARLVEHVRITGLSDDGSSVVARFDGGSICARQVLLATNAAAPLRRRLRLHVIPVYDHVIATAPLTDRQWSAIGWASRGGVTDAGNQFHYYRPTPDGRILFGGWDATYHFGGRVDERLEQRPATHRLLAQHLIDTFPALEGIEVTHTWGGPIDSTSRFTPTFGTAMGGKLGWSIGFTGLGVGASRFGAQVALDLLAEEDTDLTRLSMVRRSPIPFPPEPVRYPVIQFTKWSLAREDRTGRRNLWLRLLHRFGVGFDT